MQAFGLAIGENDMLAYLAMMAPRLFEMRRVLKPTVNMQGIFFGQFYHLNTFLWDSRGINERVGKIKSPEKLYRRGFYDS